jgi:hypothetical protein
VVSTILFFTGPVAQATSPYMPRIHRQQVKMHQLIVTLFLARFTLSLNEAEALSFPEIPIGPRFFSAMEHIGAPVTLSSTVAQNVLGGYDLHGDLCRCMSSIGLK